MVSSQQNWNPRSIEKARTGPPSSAASQTHQNPPKLVLLFSPHTHCLHCTIASGYVRNPFQAQSERDIRKLYNKLGSPKWNTVKSSTPKVVRKAASSATVGPSNSSATFPAKRTANGAKNKTLKFHKEKMRSKEKRRVSKLYKEMARFIGTRNALQCRSHHQKLEDRYLYPNKIIAHYKQHNDLALYTQIKQELDDYERKNSDPTLPHLKLQEENMENPTMADLRPIQPSSNPTSQEGSNQEVRSQAAVNVWAVNAAQIMAYDAAQMAPNWNAFFYFPTYQIY